MDLREIVNKLDDLLNRVNSAYSILDIEKKKIRTKELEYIINDKEFWNDANNAQKVSKELATLKNEIEFFEKIKNEIIGLQSIARDDIEDKDINLLFEIEKNYNDAIN